MWLRDDSADAQGVHQLELERGSHWSGLGTGNRRIEQSDPPAVRQARDGWRDCGARRLVATRHGAGAERSAMDPDRSHPILGQHIDIAIGSESTATDSMYRCIGKQLKTDRGESSCLEGDLDLY